MNLNKITEYFDKEFPKKIHAGDSIPTGNTYSIKSEICGSVALHEISFEGIKMEIQVEGSHFCIVAKEGRPFVYLNHFTNGEALEDEICEAFRFIFKQRLIKLNENGYRID